MSSRGQHANDMADEAKYRTRDKRIGKPPAATTVRPRAELMKLVDLGAPQSYG